MNRTVKAEIGGVERVLNYSVDVMFAMMEKFGGLDDALVKLNGTGPESFAAVCWFALALARDGELLRRDQGEAPLTMPEAGDFSPRMHPLEFALLRAAVIEAVTLGYQREIVREDEEIDLGLAELEKKTDTGD